MDAQGPGGADGVDPADQWVFNPETGTYELRLTNGPAGRRATGAGRPERPSAAEATDAAPSSTASRDRHTPPRQRRAPSVEGEDREPPGAGDRPLPAQRDRRAQRGSRRKGNQAQGRGKKKRGRGKKILMWTGGSLALLLVMGAAGAWWLIDRLNDNITKYDVGKDNDFSDDEEVNLLFIGTDTRTGDGNDAYGGEASEGADTTILMHFSQDRSHATGLSIPRDLITDIPECEVRREDGTVETIPGSENVRFNQSMGANGRDPGCVWNTVEQLTGVEINHFMMADFQAVKDLSSAVGGVPVCVAEPIDDPKSGLQLDAGDHVLEGEDALSFVRTRHSVGTGSDLSRIELQQQFVASMARQITDGGMLTDPGKLWDLADTATRSLSVDDGIGSIQRLRDLASTLGRVPMSDLNFVTLPVLDNPDEPEDAKATVVVDERRAAPLLEMIRQDISPRELEEREAEREAAEEEAAAAAPEDIRVDVYNGGDVIGAAQETLDWLQNQQGVPLSTNAGNAPSPQETTTLEYGPDQAGQAAALAGMMGLPDSALQEQSAEAGDAPMVLILGDDFRGAGEPIEVAPDLPDDVDSITADDEDVCAS
ncbi:LytR family transcriptional regulator [Streptomyces sp. 3MP-14]|uniref:LytR family transcriptional regulator n=1 Tax=Streptomyces mimosae TaxID=2586635 RepID=A0A5N5ZXM5_9ACTN|nr:MULTISPECIES: LCP family protein [Streptomyces]KAB8160130.1 LytR family transcriptional regulator [Streptomyces mimosae]KAB8176701.1 LytR family transcriptional regulator [Streptomyces sp. 3MP-14]